MELVVKEKENSKGVNKIDIKNVNRDFEKKKEETDYLKKQLMKQSRIRFKQKMLLTLMQNFWKIIMQMQNEIKNYISPCRWLQFDVS